MIWFLTRTCVVCLVVMLIAPSLKIRFELPDALVYYLPFAAFFLITLFISITRQTYFHERLAASFVFLLFFFPTFIAFFVGNAANLQLLILVALNCGLGIVIVLFPWNQRLLHEFLVVLSCLGAVLALDTIIFAGSDELLADVSELVTVGYLSVGLATGMACLAALYLMLTKISPVSLFLFSVTWVGLALTRGRGTFFTCAVITMLYLAVYFADRRSKESWTKKFTVLAIFAAMAPYVFYKLMSLSFNRGKWDRLLEGIDVELERGGRGDLANQAIEKISNSPLIGNGLGEYQLDGGHPHSIFLQFGVDAGMIGILSISAFIMTLLVIGIKNIRNIEPGRISMSLAYLALFTYLIANVVKAGDSYLGRELFILSALPIGLALAIRNVNRRYKYYRVPHEINASNSTTSN